MDRGRSPSQGAHIRHSASPSPHAFPNLDHSGVGLQQPLQQPLSQDLNQQQFNQFSQPIDYSQSAFNQQSLFNFDQSNTQSTGNTIDPSFLDHAGGSSQDFVDPILFDSNPPLSQMATSQAHSPTPPHLLQVQPGLSRNASTSPHHSPSFAQQAFPSPHHSRHASLDPSSAANPNIYNSGSEWANMSFQGHRRAPSETAYSDVSSQHNSPFLGNTDSFEEQNPSPLLGAQTDQSLFPDVMGDFNQFTLTENGQPRRSPGHSPHVSPSLMPQQHSLPPFTAANNFGLTAGSNQGIGLYNQPMDEPFPAIQGGLDAPQYHGNADEMSPPEINIEFAPPSRVNSFEPPKPGVDQGNALSPPDRSRSRNRMRTKSDPGSHNISRSSSAGSTLDRNSLSPASAKSRSPSPSSKVSNRRSSTSSLPQRDYILDLADPTRQPAGPAGEGQTGPRRTQKHPATFQCSLCPKKFTRAYNLRSHLRTHTDERPFVCSVCGKAFARQHDRKRHEGLHSGEKKFVCRGQLKDGGNWGCGRRFARADALGRHFRSEAGRVCIRPLLEEEAAEKGWQQQQQAALAQQQQNGLLASGMSSGMGLTPGLSGFDAFGNPLPSDPLGGVGMPAPTYALPAAILAQYPALAGIQWDQLPAGPPPDEHEIEGEISGRSSFDASSGGEYDFEEGEGDGNEGASRSFGWSGFEQGQAGRA